MVPEVKMKKALSLANTAAVAGGLVVGAVEEGGGPGVWARGEGGAGLSGNGAMEAAQEFSVEFGGVDLSEPLGGGGLVFGEGDGGEGGEGGDGIGAEAAGDLGRGRAPQPGGLDRLPAEGEAPAEAVDINALLASADPAAAIMAT